MGLRLFPGWMSGFPSPSLLPPLQDLQTLRTVVENMVAVVNNALKSFSEMQTLFLSGVANEKVRMYMYTSLVPRPPQTYIAALTSNPRL